MEQFIYIEINTNMKKTKTNRGFSIVKFNDTYGIPCSIQKSSSAMEDRLWIGVDDPQPKVMAINAASVGVETNETTGWIDYPIPKEVLLATRMHINRKQAKKIVKVLKRFINDGEI